MKNIIPPSPSNPSIEKDVFEAFIELVRILRNECPWDRKQTNKSIAHLTIEESYEIMDAIDKNDDDEFSKELGDVLLHVLLHSVIAEQRGAFNIIDVINKIHKKMVHRHPHVFGDTKINSEDDVVKNWELLKKSEGKKSALEGVPKGLPALLKAERIQHKAAKVGFDWDDKNLVWDKVFEEVDELKETINKGDKVRMTEEFGDVLFSLVNAARHEQIVAEEALHFTNNKFIKRFQYIEKKAAEINLSLDDLSLSEMDKLWDEAKKI
ncbi:MAG: nucleoside triphosphate pyrophosphohydrolase [Candidatus Kapaibacterium sp.]|nr:nucleoside triphosphate pyrophosphohydrolase [Ignavibacteriota bacterium]